ncbi:MAG: circularly permuted type 2 ATP-grasp protein [Rhodospirillaceae bacterium]|nr:circularly permuted type 2 ATP-grasp protein [Rhodospirillaceae bacterium]
MLRGPAFDEMTDPAGGPRPAWAALQSWLDATPLDLLHRKHGEAEALFRRLGITFYLYGDGAAAERMIPFDVLPRILSAAEWSTIERGCIQRVRALNMFLHDIYHEQEILRAGRIPPDLVIGNRAYRPEMAGVDLPGKVYSHIAGIDIVRTGPDDFLVLEDNLRTPSGVSYMLENRETTMRLFPDLFAGMSVRPVGSYPDQLLQNLRAVAPPGRPDPAVVLLTPGRLNAAYFEHVFLAEQMGVELVEGRDLFVDGGRIFMRTTGGPEQIDVIYRRIDDDFLDPLAFDPESVLGVAGLLSVVRGGGVTLANAIGAGVADDKAIYSFVPEIVRFYLGEEPVLANVPSYLLRNPEDCRYVLEHLDELVVKEVHGSGGHGMLIGPKASRQEREAYRARILADPAAFMAQPTLALSTCPTLVEDGIAPRHVDLRPFVLSGEVTSLVPGAFTRVALPEGSLVVNSSQGGGTKDTWVLDA